MWRNLLLAAAALACHAADPRLLLPGRVVDENNTAVADAKVSVRPAADPAADTPITSTGPSGSFAIPLPGPGRYLLTVSHPGFFVIERRPLEVESAAQQVEIVLNHSRELMSSIEVHEPAASIDPDKTDSQKTLTNVDILNLPFHGRDVGNALLLLPGALQDQSGIVHLSGSSANQVLYTLDGFNITDPVRATFNTRLNIDGVQSLQYSSARYTPELGKGSAGQVAIATRMGTDAFRYDATNFAPGIDTASGLHIGTWSPRFELSGPLVKKRVWFAESAQGVYSQNVIEDVKGPNRTSVLHLDNLFRIQANLTPRDQVFASFLFNSSDAPRSGLSVLDPMSTTVDRRSRTWFFSWRQMKYLRGGAVLEWGYAEDRTFTRQIPQGTGMYVITPFGRRGNHFLDSTEEAARRQLLLNFSPKSFHAAGLHQWKTGIDVDRVRYQARNHRSGTELWGLSGTQLNRVMFSGSGIFSRPNLEASSFLVDTWKPRTRLTLQAGIRQDWDELLRNVVFSPRLSAAWSPFAGARTRLTAGYAVTRDATPLDLFSRPLDQLSVTYNFAPDGSPISLPMYTYFTIAGRLKTPLYRNWTAGVEQRLPRRLVLTLDFTRKRGRDGLTYLAIPGLHDPAINAIFHLTNYRRDVFDSAEATLRQSFGKQYEWMVSYTRSRALSNAVLDLSIDQPLWVTNNVGRMPWDAPHHVLALGHFPTPLHDWSFAYRLEARNGFPFSTVTDYGSTIGEINSRRFPAYFDLDFFVERRLRFGKRFVALRAGYTNITDHLNPQVVNNVMGAEGFLNYYGSQGRHAVFRLRWLGAAD